MAHWHEYRGFTQMIKDWLKAQGWALVREGPDDDLYTKGAPVCMNTAAALFQELMDRASAHDFRKRRYIEAQAELAQLKSAVYELRKENDNLKRAALPLTLHGPHRQYDGG